MLSAAVSDSGSVGGIAMAKALTLKAAAAILKITRQGLQKKAAKLGMLKRQENPFVRGGWHWSISERDVTRLLKEKGNG